MQKIMFTVIPEQMLLTSKKLESRAEDVQGADKHVEETHQQDQLAAQKKYSPYFSQRVQSYHTHAEVSCWVAFQNG